MRSGAYCGPFIAFRRFMSQPRVRPLLIAALPVAILGALIVIISNSADAGMFMPHAHCYLFNRPLMLLHGWSDLFIGLSYVSISATLVYLVVRVQKELPFHWMMLAFAIFIIACGATHFMELWTLQAPHPRYWLAGWLKCITAIASLVTAVLLPPLIPKIRGVLRAARLANERKTELEKAYAELSELYRIATADAPSLQPKKDAAVSEGAAADEEHEWPHDLAHMAKEVTIHARELERAKETAEAANQAKDQFLAVLSHELRTPLTPALAAASDLENASDIDPQELRESLAVIRRNIELEARLVDDLLDVTRISKGKLELHLSVIDLHETIRHAVEMCRTVADAKKLEVALALNAAESFIKGDAARIAQVFWNLVFNAVKFTPQGGRITVETSNPETGRVMIAVTDNGIGIQPELLSQIFEPFHQGEYSTTRVFGGVGLGLSIAKGLVEGHGGSIEARSEGRNRGASFVIDLPAFRRTAAPAGNGSAVVKFAVRRSLRILLVEDHDDTRATLRRLLTRWGHEVKGAASVGQAVECAKAFQPHLLLSDVGLPDGTGMDVLAELKKRGPIPAIAMSGFGMETDLQKTAEAGFHTHLVKPFAAELLKETVERVGADDETAKIPGGALDGSASGG